MTHHHHHHQRCRGARARIVLYLIALFAPIFQASSSSADDPVPAGQLEQSFQKQTRPLIETYCFKCHSGEKIEADVDFSEMTSIAELRKHIETWQRASEMLDSRQMPPKSAKQPSDEERASLNRWVREFLTAEASARDGDPGRVVLRRLNNAEYTYTIRDMTGVASLNPTREFPVDGAAGEGFTNTGNALVMSPALVTKYLDAAKEVASHAVLLPGGIRFSPHASRRDWTEETLTRIRDFYRPFVDLNGGTAVDLQGIKFETNEGGRLPIAKYLAATLAARADLENGRTTLDDVARGRGLNRKYLGILWSALTTPDRDQTSPLMKQLRQRWRGAEERDAAAIVAFINDWQRALWKFNAIGHIGRHLGREDGPAAWMEPVSPLVPRQEVRFKLTPAREHEEITLYLNVRDAGDGNEHDEVIWERPRLAAPGRPDIPLRDLRALLAALDKRREAAFSNTARCLEAAAAASVEQRTDVAELSKRFGVEPSILASWLDYLGLARGEVRFESYLKQKLEKVETYDFVKGWNEADALSVLANSSDQHVRIPGNMKPHSVAVHPAPTRNVIVGWRNPNAETVRIDGSVQHAHPECGNGITWALELWRGNTRQRLAGGVSQGAAVVKVGPTDRVAARKGDVFALVIGPRDGNHSCDLTAIDLTIKGDASEWNLARDVAPNILAGNPHADAFGNADVWHFASEPDRRGSTATIPGGSLLARWQSSPSNDEKKSLAERIQSLLRDGPAALPKDSPDRVLHQQLTSLSGPLLSAARNAVVAEVAGQAAGGAGGVDPSLFGKRSNGQTIDPLDLCVRAPSTIEVRIPAELVNGCEFVTAGRVHPDSSIDGSVQLQVTTSPPPRGDLLPSIPVVVAGESKAKRRFESAFAEMRQLFPAALCYYRIVPVDEAVTLNLYFREDSHLARLMLDDALTAHIDELWRELFYVSQEPLLLESAFDQIYEYATQDRPDMVKSFQPMRKPVHDRAARFRESVIATEPKHLESLLAFAARAFRRPATPAEARELKELYASLRKEEIPHEDAWRLTLARVLVSPAFLYHLEVPPPGTEQKRVSDDELASRLSYFLWSSAPDDQLLARAAARELRKPEVLLAQTQRMLNDPRVRRLATEFGAQWLHIHGFDQFDEKSDQSFPTFAGLRAAMYEESILFLADLFQNNRSVLNLLDADYTFLNQDLARHYGIAGVDGPEWRRVDGMRARGRGGILAQATVLSKQAGASRTSPILRGDWLSEVVLGERLPRPPKNVPQLPEAAPSDLSERQLIERHSIDPACIKCHQKIDPLGFALENYDAIGRFRTVDASGHKIDANSRLLDGTALVGYEGLRKYLMNDRREAFLRQFNRKLLGYALGRSVQLSDEPLLTRIRAAMQTRDYQTGAAIEAIVLSKQFQEIRGRDENDAE